MVHGFKVHVSNRFGNQIYIIELLQEIKERDQEQVIKAAELSQHPNDALDLPGVKDELLRHEKVATVQLQLIFIFK